ncbi:hypothetical protein SDJN03_17218, partial [Cucurbita argyrosperma subsp. sororia]
MGFPNWPKRPWRAHCDQVQAQSTSSSPLFIAHTAEPEPEQAWFEFELATELSMFALTGESKGTNFTSLRQLYNGQILVLFALRD